MIRSTIRLLFLAILLGNLPAIARPNIIVVMTDDQGWGDFGFSGNTVVKTPHLDAMADRSAQMTRFYVSPVCTPTRACLMSGRYNFRTRAIDTYIGRAMMETEEVTIAEALKPAGYATGLFGKWHLGDNYPLRPQDQGFDEVLMHRGGGIGQPSDPIGGEGKYTDPILFHNGEEKAYEGYCTDIYFDAAFDFMAESKSAHKPFFAYIATNAPHGPYHDVPEDLRKMYMEMDLRGGLANPEVSDQQYERQRDNLARVFAMETNIDQNIGRLFDTLKKLNLYEDTLVMFLVDNGPGGPRFVGSMRGKKGSVVDGGIRTPFLAHWPKELEAGHRSDRIAAHIDIMPTILDAAGANLPDQTRLDGTSILPLLRGKSTDWADRTLFLQWHRGSEPTPYKKFAAVGQRWKLVQETQPGWEEGLALPPKGYQFGLYDMENDLGETSNLVASQPEVFNKMKADYDQWFDDVSNTRPDNYAPPAIVIGTPHENPTVLTWQDWIRQSEGHGWKEPNALGYWILQIDRPGRYEVRMVFDAREYDETLEVSLGGKTRSLKVSAGSKAITLPALSLKAGPTEFHGELKSSGAVRGVYQIFITKQ